VPQVFRRWSAHCAAEFVWVRLSSFSTPGQELFWRFPPPRGADRFAPSGA
jgi:hypothetical protein